MTMKFFVGGVEQTDTTTRIKGDFAGLSNAADGAWVESTYIIKDPTGTLSYQQLVTVYAEESACSLTRCHTGFVFGVTVARGPYLTGVGRQWELKVADLNGLLRLRTFTGATGKRPRESFNARIAWLLGSVALDGLVFDDGLVASNTDEFDEADYRQRYADDVLSEIAGTLGMIFFVRWDSTAGHPSLFCDVPTAAVHDSTLRISTVPTDYDGTTTFHVHPGPELAGAGEDIYDGIDLQAVGISIYRQRPTTYTEFGLHRDATFETTRIGRLATAERYANDFLLSHSGQIDTITCVVKLPASKLNLIDAGMRLAARFEFMPGFEDFAWVRVTRRTILNPSPTGAFYDVQLELSNRGLTASGVGSPGDFPNPPPTPGQDHWYEGDLTVCCPLPAPSMYGEFADAPIFLALTTYDYSFEITSNSAPGGTAVITAAHDVVTDSLVDHDYTTPGPVFTPPGTSDTITGSFTMGGVDRLARFGLGVLGDIAETCTSVHFWVDPVGWVPIPPSSGTPAPGQWVGIDPPEVVTMTGADGTTEWPFAAGSLRVFVDNVEQTSGLVAQDGAAGTFTLGFTPTPTEVVTVQYQGI